jgi:lipopolysaccharide transport system ATP-binding protein
LNFQKKCFEYILDLKRRGTSIILVSHSPGAIWSVCDKGLFMDRGIARVFGPVEDVVRAYDNQNTRNAIQSELQFAKAEQAHNCASVSPSSSTSISGTGEVECVAFRLVCPESGETITELQFGKALAIELDLQVHQTIDNVILRVVADAAHYKNIATIDNYEQGAELANLTPGRYRFRIDIQHQNFRPGAYIFNMAVAQRHLGVHLFLWLKCAGLVVLSPTDRFIYSDPFAVMHLNANFSHIALESTGAQV